MKLTPRTEHAFGTAYSIAASQRREYVTPEHLLWGLMTGPEGIAMLRSYHAVWEQMQAELINKTMTVDGVPEEVGDYEVEASMQTAQVQQWCEMMATAAEQSEVDLPHVLRAIMSLENSFAKFILEKYTTTDEGDLMATFLTACRGEEPLPHEEPDEPDEPDIGKWLDDFDINYSDMEDDPEATPEWHKLVTCLNEQVDRHPPLIGRENEMERTIQVLCRKFKNNPLHVGDPGVGKTALVHGLAARIEAGQVPERLKGARIYQMDIGSMVAGTTYRGQFEARIKAVMEGVSKEEKGIIYIDEIHTLVGAGAAGDHSLDGVGLIKPYLENGAIRFIGSTTYQEYNRYIQPDKALNRRFQQIDVPEPSVSEAISIVERLSEGYAAFHNVHYGEGVVRYAVEASARYITDRHLPDKAIDLIDEAGAYREIHPLMRRHKGEAAPSPANQQTVDRKLVQDVLARICKMPPATLHEDDNQHLDTLSERIRAKIFGQDEAVRQAVQAVLMGKAGLLDEGKPIASMLFIGPTGVGKTELCKVLADELGIGLVRFDMSEFAERHTVAKLIGAPAGYVGYEDGGLLTDAIRRTPRCVLLLDEIEKAHADIYNILLQVMDYARLTDSHGQKADFTGVILVMTSNAGAQYAHQASIGFGAAVPAGDAMMHTVRRTFKPEFLARLSSTVVFGDMSRDMAGRILDKKLGQLAQRLGRRNLTLHLTDEARSLLLDRGFSSTTGARRMDNAIAQLLSAPLSQHILFGKVSAGRNIRVSVDGGVIVFSS